MSYLGSGYYSTGYLGSGYYATSDIQFVECVITFQGQIDPSVTTGSSEIDPSPITLTSQVYGTYLLSSLIDSVEELTGFIGSGINLSGLIDDSPIVISTAVIVELAFSGHIDPSATLLTSGIDEEGLNATGYIYSTYTLNSLVAPYEVLTGLISGGESLSGEIDSTPISIAGLLDDPLIFTGAIDESLTVMSSEIDDGATLLDSQLSDVYTLSSNISSITPLNGQISDTISAFTGQIDDTPLLLESRFCV